MGSGGGGGGGGGNGDRDRNRGIERGRTTQPPVSVTRPSPPVDRGEDKPSRPAAEFTTQKGTYVVEKATPATAGKIIPGTGINTFTTDLGQDTFLSRPVAPKSAQEPAAPTTGAKLGDTGGPASEKMREVGVKYGFDGKADIRKTAPSGELARERGPSPGDVLATVGDLPGIDRDTAAANIAGRPGLDKDVLGDLATRAREGQLPAGKVVVPGAGTAALNLLNLAGKKSAMSILTKIAKDEPVIKDGKVTYATEIVKDERGGVAGIVEPGPIEGTKVYSGRPEFNPLAPPEAEQEPEPAPAPTPTDPVVEDVEQATLLSPTKKRARGTRSKRFAGETLLEGQGALYR